MPLSMCCLACLPARRASQPTVPAGRGAASACGAASPAALGSACRQGKLWAWLAAGCLHAADAAGLAGRSGHRVWGSPAAATHAARPPMRPPACLPAACLTLQLVGSTSGVVTALAGLTQLALSCRMESAALAPDLLEGLSQVPAAAAAAAAAAVCGLLLSLLLLLPAVCGLLRQRQRLLAAAGTSGAHRCTCLPGLSSGGLPAPRAEPPRGRPLPCSCGAWSCARCGWPSSRLALRRPWPASRTWPVQVSTAVAAPHASAALPSARLPAEAPPRLQLCRADLPCISPGPLPCAVRPWLLPAQTCLRRSPAGGRASSCGRACATWHPCGSFSWRTRAAPACRGMRWPAPGCWA